MAISNKKAVEAAKVIADYCKEVRVKSNQCGFAVPDSDYFPRCGAKMDGEQ